MSPIKNKLELTEHANSEPLKWSFSHSILPQFCNDSACGLLND